MAARQLVKVAGKLTRILINERFTRRAGLCLPRVLRGKLETVFVALQRPAPVVQVNRDVQRSLGARVILVLDGQLRESWTLAARKRRVSLLKLTQKNGFERPGVRCDVVHVEQEQVAVVRQAQQARYEDRTAAKVEAMLEMSLEVLQHL